MLDHTDEVRAGGGERARDSTLSAICRDGQDVLLLTSGHGVLPFDSDGRVMSEYVETKSKPARIVIRDGAERIFVGRVLMGAFAGGQCRDWAIVRVPNMAPPLYDAWHAATGRTPPFRIRQASLSEGTPIWHISRLLRRPQRARGVVVDADVATADVKVSDGSTRTYANLILAEGDNGIPFSVSGESGSLVVDDEQRVVGTVIAGDGTRSYVLPAHALKATLVGRGFTKFLDD